jgi:hypothetical protein
MHDSAHIACGKAPSPSDTSFMTFHPCCRGLLYCMEFLEDNLHDWLSEELQVQCSAVQCRMGGSMFSASMGYDSRGELGWYTCWLSLS